MAHKKLIANLIIAAMVSTFGLLVQPAAQPSGPVTQDEIEILASGPIHEAFAEAVVLDPESGMETPKPPPPLIEEIAPSQKPAGDVEWIPGYWAWDDERDDYIWVSGIWRVPPPGRQWVPGYWTRTGSRYQWVSGYWANVAEKQVQYLPEPPASVEVGPSSYAPSQDHIWIPGCWIWQNGRYAWRAGYWAVADPQWLWVPAQYTWTPRGYIYIGGYWDYTVIHRGIIFAPVYFPPRVHLGLAFTFSPGFVIGLNIFDDALFLRPRYRHYYFGDYYAPVHYRRGIYPWFSLHARRVVYDPIYVHQRWNHRNDRQWESRLENTFQQRRDRPDLRPARTYDHRSTGVSAGARAAESRAAESRSFVRPLDRVDNNTRNAYRFQPLSEKERSNFTNQEKAVRNFQRERQLRETPATGSREMTAPAARSLPNRDRTKQSPITDRSVKSREETPPRRYTEPAPNPNIEPLERRSQPASPQSQVIRPDDRIRTDDRGRPAISSPRSSSGEGSPRRRLNTEERPARSGR